MWGCGGDVANNALLAYREDRKQLINRARKVDKAQFAGKFSSLILSKTFC